VETIDESKSSDSAVQPGDRLDSWKEISAYLKKDLRTARRWEKKEGLPVHRHIHDRASTVYAFKSEIEEWRARRKPELHEKDEDGESSGAAPTLAQSQVLEPARPVDSSGSKMRRLSPRVRALVGAILGVSILATVYLVSKRPSNRPSKLSHDGDQLIARSADDNAPAGKVIDAKPGSSTVPPSGPIVAELAPWAGTLNCIPLLQGPRPEEFQVCIRQVAFPAARTVDGVKEQIPVPEPQPAAAASTHCAILDGIALSLTQT